MKRFIFLLLAVVMLLSLTACGDNKTNGSMTEPTARPSMSPMVSPDVSDGMVNDTDGIIGNAARRMSARPRPSARIRDFFLISGENSVIMYPTSGGYSTGVGQFLYTGDR